MISFIKILKDKGHLLWRYTFMVLTFVLFWPGYGIGAENICSKWDQLTENMKGKWVGHGTKVTLVSSNSWSIRVKSETSVQNKALFVNSEFIERELFANNREKIYFRTYWIRFDSCNNDFLNVSVVESLESKYGARGQFDGNELIINQDMGQGFEFRSSTNWLNSKESLNQMEFLKENEVLQRTQIQYSKVW